MVKQVWMKWPRKHLIDPKITRKNPIHKPVNNIPCPFTCWRVNWGLSCPSPSQVLQTQSLIKYTWHGLFYEKQEPWGYLGPQGRCRFLRVTENPVWMMMMTMMMWVTMAGGFVMLCGWLGFSFFKANLFCCNTGTCKPLRNKEPLWRKMRHLKLWFILNRSSHQVVLLHNTWSVWGFCSFVEMINNVTRCSLDVVK